MGIAARAAGTEWAVFVAAGRKGAPNGRRWDPSANSGRGRAGLCGLCLSQRGARGLEMGAGGIRVVAREIHWALVGSEWESPQPPPRTVWVVFVTAGGFAGWSIRDGGGSGPSPGYHPLANDSLQ